MPWDETNQTMKHGLKRESCKVLIMADGDYSDWFIEFSQGVRRQVPPRIGPEPPKNNEECSKEGEPISRW